MKEETTSRVGPFKIVGLITSLVTISACFVGAVMWISVNMANNQMSIEILEFSHKKLETLVTKNSKILSQHDKLLMILDQHDSSIKVLTNFMTQGGRFTEQDGREMNTRLYTVEEQMHKYDILATELKWIKKSMIDIENNITVR
ncbi:MAG: hypothetical protein GOV02_02245, partial [Candidatus Aenigmarchaeota archaeon]|nr:hypothetical protein [Candidatus Aenigmarchaeota archaeon]